MDPTCESFGDAASQSEQEKIPLDAMVKETRPNNDNLEYFPINVLLNIFAKTDDIGLLYLSETSCRFATITPIVFEERYANKYFVIDGGDHDIYSAQFDRFGQFITAIEVNRFDESKEDQWLMEILQKHTDHIEKLAFNDCTFESSDILSQAMSITHLSFRNVDFRGRDDLPEYQHLLKLKTSDVFYISYESLDLTIQNNPLLQSFVYHNYGGAGTQFMVSIADNLKHLKELDLVHDKYHCSKIGTVTPHEIDKMVNAFKHLELLALEVDLDNIELLRCLGMECKSLKYLKLYYNKEDTKVLQVVCLFQQIECLHLSTILLDHDQLIKINSLVEHLPYLRVLYLQAIVFEDDEHDIRSDTLCLFHKCPSLQTIKYIDSYDDTPKLLPLDAQFFKNFIETVITGKPDARIELQKSGKTIGTVTKNGIVVRNKLVHWTGCDTNQSTLNVRLLDLAKHAVNSDTIQKNLLDLIFDYLDVHSLCAFAETNKRGKRMVESYIPKHSQQHGTFTITNEFESYCLSEEQLTESFNLKSSFVAQHVTDLKIVNISDYFEDI